MIKLTYKDLNADGFPQGMLKLFNATGLSSKTAYKIAKIQEVVSKEADKARTEFMGIGKKHGVELRPGADIPADKQALVEADLATLMDTKFEIQQMKIAVSEIEKVGLSAKEILALDPILHGLEVVEGGAA